MEDIAIFWSTVMSRRSARIRGQKRKFEEITENDIAETLVKKFKKKDDNALTMEIERRRQQFLLQNQWVPITNDNPASSVLSSVSTKQSVVVKQTHVTNEVTARVTNTCLESSSCMISPHKNNTPQELIMPNPSTMTAFRFQNLFTTPAPMRNSPLPSLKWADSKEVWELMLRKEQNYARNPDLLERHPGLQSRMRAILLDWLIEVCEVYRLHRETFHLAVDFIDRYLCITQDSKKSQLQLLGITGLFVAAKLEEIYPPKLAEFAYVTDGACTEGEILDQELVMLKTLKWDLCPMTVNSWLNIFLQLVNMEALDERGQSFLLPQYSQHAFINIARLLDLCALDIGSLQYSYSVIATSATYHMSTEEVALSVSGYAWEDIAACVQWMAPFALTLREAGSLDLKFFQHIANEDAHNIQTHSVDLSMLEKAQAKSIAVAKSARSSPEISHQHPGIITPPQT